MRKKQNDSDSGSVVEPIKPSDSMEDNQNDSGKKKARVLVDCSYGSVDTVVELTDSEMESAKSIGAVDDHPEAVRYAQTLAAGQL